MKKSTSKLHISLLSAASLYFIYMQASIALFYFTAGGWNRFAIEINYFIWVLPICSLSLFIARLFKARSVISTKGLRNLLICIALIQIVSMLFNYGDCFDGEGTYNFIQTIGKNIQSVCNELPAVESLVPLGLTFIIRIIYYLLNIVLVYCLIFFPSKSK